MDTSDPHTTARDAGAASVEYGLLLALVAGVVLSAVTSLGGAVADGFETTCSALSGGKGTVSAPAGKGGGLSTAPGVAKKGAGKKAPGC